MTFEKMYAILRTQAYYAVCSAMTPARKDKMQELVCQAYEKYKNDIETGREPNINIYKAFITQRAKEVDFRSVCKSGYGGTSRCDVMSPYRRRPDQQGNEIVEFNDWMTCSTRTVEAVTDTMAFNVDFPDWFCKLNKAQQQVLQYLMQGYKATKIAELAEMAYCKVKQIIKEIQILFIKFFRREVKYARANN